MKCEVCNYVPDEDDIKHTGFKLKRCPKCGKMACDLYLMVSEEGETLCAECMGTPVLGNNRKFWLENEYPEKE